VSGLHRAPFDRPQRALAAGGGYRWRNCGFRSSPLASPLVLSCMPQSQVPFWDCSHAAGWQDSVHLDQVPGTWQPSWPGTPRDIEEKEAVRWGELQHKPGRHARTAFAGSTAPTTAHGWRRACWCTQARHVKMVPPCMHTSLAMQLPNCAMWGADKSTCDFAVGPVA
jgi:hypothetical protein